MAQPRSESSETAAQWPECSTQPGHAFLPSCQRWPTGIEGQRKSDLGNGFYLNPVLAGDHPDPTIIRDGQTYYMTHSSFESYPGLLIWQSTDLINWQPLTHALSRNIGSVWAPELVQHAGRYYIYIPAKKTASSQHPNDIWVIHASDIRGPWSDPVALGNARIDPGHAVGEDGRRYLFLSGGLRVPLSENGLRITGPEEHVYDAWHYPEEWDVEAFSQEGPKLLRHQGWYHMTLAIGGTAGPPTSHMVICARSRSIHGPWEHHPRNPVLRTRSAAQRWWSKGHGTLIQGPGDHQWFMFYHGYEAGFHTLGRQTLMVPMRYTADGWFETAEADEGQPLPQPIGGKAGPHGMPLSDDFSGSRLGPQWHFFRGGIQEAERIHLNDHTLHLQAKGQSPSDSSPLCVVSGDHAYEVEVDVAFDATVQVGLVLFYNDRLYAGMGINDRQLVLHRYGMDQREIPKPAGMQRRLRLRLRNSWHVLTLWSSLDEGKSWNKFPIQMDVSGYHHNVGYGFMSLRPGIYACGQGQARFRRWTYRALAYRA